MAKRGNDKHKLNNFQFQCLRNLKMQRNEKGYLNEAEIARKFGVNKSTVHRCIRSCVERELLTETEYNLTKKGEKILEYYLEIYEEILDYLKRIGVEAKEREEAAENMIDSVDIKTIQTICIRERLHLQYENIDANKQETQKLLGVDELRKYLSPGTYEVDFSIYRQDKDSPGLSMADRGFEKPAKLYFQDDAKYLELKIREMEAYSMIEKQHLMKGYVSAIKILSKNDVLKLLDIQENTVKIPLEEIWFELPGHGELIGEAQLIMSCSVGEMHMPESVARLHIRV